MIINNKIDFLLIKLINKKQNITLWKKQTNV